MPSKHKNRMIIGNDKLLFDLELKPIQDFLLVLMHLVLKNDHKYLSLICCRLRNIIDYFLRDSFSILRYPYRAKNTLYRHMKQLFETTLTPRFLKPYNSFDLLFINTFIQPLKGVKYQDRVLGEFGMKRGKRKGRKIPNLPGYPNDSISVFMCIRCGGAVYEIDKLIAYNLGYSLKEVSKHGKYSASGMYSKDKDTKRLPGSWLGLEKYEPYTDLDLGINFVDTDFITPCHDLDLVRAVFYILAIFDDIIIDESLLLYDIPVPVQSDRSPLRDSEAEIHRSYIESPLMLVLYEMPRLLYRVRMKLLESIKEITLLSISLFQGISGHKRELLIKILRTASRDCNSLAYKKILLKKFLQFCRSDSLAQKNIFLIKYLRLILLYKFYLYKRIRA